MFADASPLESSEKNRQTILGRSATYALEKLPKGIRASVRNLHATGEVAVIRHHHPPRSKTQTTSNMINRLTALVSEFPNPERGLLSPNTHLPDRPACPDANTSMPIAVLLAKSLLPGRQSGLRWRRLPSLGEIRATAILASLTSMVLACRLTGRCAALSYFTCTDCNSDRGSLY